MDVLHLEEEMKEKEWGECRGQTFFKKQDGQGTKAEYIYSFVLLSLPELSWDSVQSDMNVQCLNPYSMGSIKYDW